MDEDVQEHLDRIEAKLDALISARPRSIVVNFSGVDADPDEVASVLQGALFTRPPLRGD